MSSRLMLPGLLLAMALGCSGDAGAGTSNARLSRHAAVPGDLPVPLQFEASRNFVAEYEDFMRMVSEQHADTSTVHAALGVAATKQFNYTTVDGTEMCGWEYELQGPKPDAPFFEAFAAGYPGQSFFVFFQKSWFRWHAVDCGFHESGVFGQIAAAP